MITYENILADEGETIRVRGRFTRNKPIPLGVDLRAMLDQICIMIVQGWMPFLKHEPSPYLHPDLTPGVAALHFLYAKYLGMPYPRYLSLCFTPRQVLTMAGTSKDEGALYDFLEAVSNGDVPKARSLLWGIGAGDPSVHKYTESKFPDLTLSKFLSLGGLAWHGARLPLDFPAETAAELYDEFCPEGGAILDPCHGWGGRLTGFYMASNPRTYTGIDPSPAAHEGVSLLSTTFAPFAEKDKRASLVQTPYEKTNLATRFDFAFTSPPYWDTEEYEGCDQSFRLYTDFEKWCTGFYLPFFQKTFKYLKAGCTFAVNVGSQTYPLGERGKQLAAKVGFKFIERRSHIVKQNSYHKTEDERGESLFIFRKP